LFDSHIWEMRFLCSSLINSIFLQWK
jgi:hypothetical protein